MNSSGSMIAERRVLPAQQRLDADDAEVVEVVDRLVDETELVARRAPSGGRTRARCGGVISVCISGMEDLVAVLAGAPWPGTARRRRRAAARRRSAGRRSAMPMLVLTVSGIVAPSSSNGWRITSSSRSATSSGATVEWRAVDQDDELVAAHPRRSCRRRATCVVSRGGHGHEQPVAGLVAERVVDVLEVVEIDEQRRAASCRCRRLRASSCSMRSMISARFGRPVNASCSAWWRSSPVRSPTRVQRPPARCATPTSAPRPER